MDVIALVVSVFAFVLSLVQFLKDTTREKKEATLDAYNELQDNVFSQINSLLREIKKDSCGRIIIDKNDPQWPTLTNYLAKIERFSVGINSGIYSIDILNRIGGGYIIKLYAELSVIINIKKRDNIAKGKHYDEFETVVNKLKKMRGEV